MIVNNYRGMEFVREVVREDLSVPILLELQSILTKDTVDDPGIVGRLRLPADQVVVVDQRDGTVLHEPPDANEIVERMERLLQFAHTTEDTAFVHPVVRAILLHLRVILQSIGQVHEYLARKAREIDDVQRLLDRFVPASVLNYRQVALIVSMRKHPDRLYSIESHRRSHNVTYQTARTDLLKLAERRLVTTARQGRAFVFRLADDFDERIRELSVGVQN